MSRKLLVLPVLAALALVGCDDSSSSSSSSGTPATGTCDGYKGKWVFDSTVSGGGMTMSLKQDVTLTATTFSANTYVGMGTAPALMNQSSGTIKDIGGSKLVSTATTVKELDEESGTMVPSTDPADFAADTIQYSFPSAGKMKIVELNDPESEPLVYTCK